MASLLATRSPRKRPRRRTFQDPNPEGGYEICHDIALDRIMTNTNTYSIESRETFSSILLYMDHSTGPR